MLGITYQYALVAIDEFSRWVMAWPTKSQNGAAAVRGIKAIVLRFGVPKAVGTDQGLHFTCKEFQLCLTEYGIEHEVTTPYAKTSNGLVERVNRTIQEGLSKKLAGLKANLNSWHMHG